MSKEIRRKAGRATRAVSAGAAVALVAMVALTSGWFPPGSVPSAAAVEPAATWDPTQALPPGVHIVARDVRDLFPH
jgi:hypothetical protein